MMVEENAVQTVKIADAMKITDLESLKVLADPLRLSILEYLMKPSTVKRIAEKLGKPPTKLYYHFNLLEQHGLIQLVDTRVVSGIIEKHYQATAFWPTPRTTSSKAAVRVHLISARTRRLTAA